MSLNFSRQCKLLWLLSLIINDAWVSPFCRWAQGTILVQNNRIACDLSQYLNKLRLIIPIIPLDTWYIDMVKKVKKVLLNFERCKNRNFLNFVKYLKLWEIFSYQNKKSKIIQMSHTLVNRGLVPQSYRKIFTDWD